MDEPEIGQLRRAAFVALALAGTAIVVALLIAPNARVVDDPLVPTDAPVLPTMEPESTEPPAEDDDAEPDIRSPRPKEDPLADSDCGPECYGESLKRTPKP